MKQVKGFTLVEVLIAMAITAIAAMMAYSALDSAIRLSEASEEKFEEIERINKVFSILSKDFNFVSSRQPRSEYGEFHGHAFSYNNMAIPMLKLTRSGWVNPQPERFKRSDLQHVNYHYDGENLIRYSWSMVDRYDGDEPREVILLENVTNMEVKIYCTSIQTNLNAAPGSGNLQNRVTKKVDQWPLSDPDGGAGIYSDGLPGLPLGIELILEIEGWGKIRRVFDFVGNENPRDGDC